ncbi:MAG: tail fiber domain-containing protein, partial [Phycisphaerae bacterium]
SVLDQQQTDRDLVAGIGVLWQSFTPSVSGLLTRVEYYAASGNTPGGATLLLRQGEGPSGAVLAGASYAVSPNLGPISITFASAPTLVAGQVYTMMFTPNDGIAHGVAGECCNVYPGGRSNFAFDPTIDIYFKTFMLVGGQNGLGRLGVGTASPKEAIHNTGDYYGRGHFLLHANEGDGLNGTAYLQARDDSNTSSIGLRLRTQAIGELQDAINITPFASVGIGTNNAASRLHLQHLPTGNTSSLNWGFRIQTTAQSSFVTGMRVSDSGFFDVTNQIGGPAFARLSNNGTWSAVSDRRMKKDIARLGGVLDAALKLEPVSYYYIGQDRTQSPDRQIGFIAQDVEPLFPSLVTRGDDLMTLNYSGLSVVAIAALQEMKVEQDAANTQQGMEVAQLRSENDALLERIAALERRLARIEHAFGVDKPQ